MTLKSDLLLELYVRYIIFFVAHINSYILIKPKSLTFYTN